MVSLKATAMVMTLLVVCHLATNTSAAYYGCCRKYTKSRLAFASIKGFSVQSRLEMCPIDAIIFHTKRGKECADPSLPWVMKYIQLLMKKAQSIHNKSSRVPK